jgi:hypothetical protein
LKLNTKPNATCKTATNKFCKLKTAVQLNNIHPNPQQILRLSWFHGNILNLQKSLNNCFDLQMIFHYGVADVRAITASIIHQNAP